MKISMLAPVQTGLPITEVACAYAEPSPAFFVVFAELLIQMDGLLCSKHAKGPDGPDEPQVFVLAATNMPWELDMVGGASY